MNDGNNIFEKLKGKTGKIVFFLGLAGILLIYLSSFFSSEKEEKVVPTGGDPTAEYCERLEQKVSDLVCGITGSRAVSVVITLDSGKQYVYAGEGRQQTSDSGNDREQSYIIVRTADGEEKGLLVTEYMPVVRGVAIVTNGLSAAKRAEISAAVCAALDISERKVYVTQYAY